MSRQLGDVFEDLSFGPLAGLKEGGEGSGTIPGSAEARLVHLINRALGVLHSRYLISQKSIQIRCIADRTLYPLVVEHTDSFVDTDNPGSEPEKFIIDTAENPYSGDLIAIRQVFGPDKTSVDPAAVKEFMLNDDSSDSTIYVPNFDVLQVVAPVAGDIYTVLYQARHPLLGIADVSQQIYLPDGLFPALEAWVAAKVFLSKNGEEHVARGSQLMGQYEQACLRAEQDNLLVTPQSGNNKLETRGFK